jgi:hypothetical protein
MEDRRYLGLASCRRNEEMPVKRNERKNSSMGPNPYESPVNSVAPQAEKRLTLLGCMFLGSSLVLLLDVVAFNILGFITPAMMPNPYEAHRNVVFVVGAIGSVVWLASVIWIFGRLISN